ncbi:MAG: glycogen/starch/alpha-glucan phosphorylase [Rhodocyclales bacterium]|nr:glycogen/starch/alpha-glucan phosphorylase [Rhodocyclales bacterium]
MQKPAALPELDHPALDAESIRRSLYNRLIYTIGKDPITATDRDWFYAAAAVVRERMIERWMETMRSYYVEDRKRVYYLSMEFLMGRSMTNAMLNMCAENEFRDALTALGEMGLRPEKIADVEPDAALGNGGLGRLAACFLDSMATMGVAGYGYGIRYEYGMFHQGIEEGQQVEHPDNWLRYGNPWEFPRPEVLYQVKFHGRVVEFAEDHGRKSHQWVDTDDVMAMAYDYPIPGYDTGTVNNMRLWAAKASRDFDLKYFNEGNYIRAVEDKNDSENLSKVLYPDDTTEMGRELRLKQQYFFVSASLQDMLYRFAKTELPFEELPNKVAIQLNDTHPSIAVAELMRILVDQHHLDWAQAWPIVTRVFSYTNHTLMPEALETWPVGLFERVLPRHLQIIYEINHRFLRDVMHAYPANPEVWQRMSLIDEAQGRRIRMAHLAIVGSHHVNGVAALHTQLMKDTIFGDFHHLWPHKIVNMTNGVTPRRWLNQANPALAHLITRHIGNDWLKDLDQLRRLTPLAEDAAFREHFARVKRDNKTRLAQVVKQRLGIVVDPDSIFDVQIKRIHEYKRQLLNVLHVITLYNRLRGGADATPRTVVFGGKAAPGYRMAKLIIRLINDVADVVNNDPSMRDRLKLAFIPNYDVSNAELIIPAADLSEQISTAGTEASGTGNMKLALNGALTMGTLDGANVEILEEVGRENIFIFGLNTDEVAALRVTGYKPWQYYDANPELKQALDMIRDGYFCPEERGRYKPVFDNLTSGGDHYLLLADYAAYIEAQDRAGALYRDREAWLRKAVLNVAGMGKFSSDRTIGEYAKTIWNVEARPRAL